MGSGRGGGWRTFHFEFMICGGGGSRTHEGVRRPEGTSAPRDLESRPFDQTPEPLRVQLLFDGIEICFGTLQDRGWWKKQT